MIKKRIVIAVNDARCFDNCMNYSVNYTKIARERSVESIIPK